MKAFKNPKFAKNALLLATGCIVFADLGQIYRIWTQGTAKGHNLFSWVLVCFSLLIWYNYLGATHPEDTSSRLCKLFGVLTTLAISLSIIYFRYVLKTG